MKGDINMKRTRIMAGLLVIALLLMLPATALARVGSGWKDDCRGNRQQDGGYGEHNWEKVSEEPGSSCTSKGSAHYVCSYCRAQITRETKAPGHKWGSWKTKKEATCTTKGEQTRKCKVCGKTETRKTDKAAHSWGEWTVIVPPTDFSMGTGRHTCKVCGTEQTEDFYPEGTLKRGDGGDGVKALQEGLNAAGYDCGKADGDFGRKTEGAVQAIESAHGVEPDGIAWPGVQKWLGGGSAVAPEAPQQPEVTEQPEAPVDGDEYGWTPPELNPIEQMESATRIFTGLRRNPLVVTQQPEGGRIAHGGDGAHVMSIAVSGGLMPYTYEWRRQSNPRLPIAGRGGQFDQGLQALQTGANEKWGKRGSGTRNTMNKRYPTGLEHPVDAHRTEGLANSDSLFLSLPVSDGGNQATYTARTAGRYFCRITDAAGNKVDTDVAVVGYNLYIALQPKDVEISDSGSADFSCVAAGGDGSGYEYEWHLPDGSIRTSSDGKLLDVDIWGSYYCVVRCGGETVTSEAVKLYAPLLVIRSGEAYPLDGKRKTASINMFVKGGTPPYHLVWSVGGEAGTGETISEADKSLANDNEKWGWHPAPIEASEPGVYWLTVTDANGERASDFSEVVDISAEPDLVIVEQPQDGDLADQYPLHVRTTVANGVGRINYSLCWSIFDWQDDPFAAPVFCDQDFKNATDPDHFVGENVVYDIGEYYVHVEDSLGRSADTDFFSVTDSREQYPGETDTDLPAPLSVDDDGMQYAVDGQGSTAGLSMFVKGGVSPYHLVWTFGEPGSGKTVGEFDEEGDAKFGWYTTPMEVSEAGTYSLTVTDSKGDSASASLQVIEELPLMIVAQPWNCALEGKNWIYVYTTVGNGKGIMKYSLYKKEYSGTTATYVFKHFDGKNADDPDRLVGRNIVSEIGRAHV